MSDIAAFIRARLDEDEQIARAATPGPWRVTEDDVPEWARETTALLIEAGARPDGRPIRVAGPGYEGGGIWERADAEHIARHDPSRVLREVAAKRAVVNRYEAMQAGVEAAEGTVLAGASRVRLGAYLNVLHDLAAIWVDHPDFDPSWRTDG